MAEFIEYLGGVVVEEGELVGVQITVVTILG